MKDDRIKFRTPDTSWTAIVQGAVVCGVDNTQIPSIRKVKTCTHSFGVSLDEHFHEARHTSEDMAQYDGQLFACKQLTWLINEGDAIVMNEPRKVKKEFDVVFSKQDKIIRIPIYRHAMRKDEDPQDRPVRLTNSRDGMTFPISTICFR